MLSNPIRQSDRDTIWATAVVVGILSIGSFDASRLSDAWPLRPPSPSDLDWYRLTDDKKVVWHLTDPVRADGLFRAMADEYAAFQIDIPQVGVDGIPLDLAKVTSMTSTSTQENSPYFRATHILTRLKGMKIVGVRVIVFVSQSQLAFRDLLQQKDPVALLLLGIWYAQSNRECWWLERRALFEGQAIREYLERYYHSMHEVLKLLPPRAGIF